MSGSPGRRAGMPVVVHAPCQICSRPIMLRTKVHKSVADLGFLAYFPVCPECRQEVVEMAGKLVEKWEYLDNAPHKT